MYTVSFGALELKLSNGTYPQLNTSDLRPGRRSWLSIALWPLPRCRPCTACSVVLAPLGGPHSRPLCINADAYGLQQIGVVLPNTAEGTRRQFRVRLLTIARRGGSGCDAGAVGYETALVFHNTNMITHKSKYNRSARIGCGRNGTVKREHGSNPSAVAVPPLRQCDGTAPLM